MLDERRLLPARRIQPGIHARILPGSLAAAFHLPPEFRDRANAPQRRRATPSRIIAVVREASIHVRALAPRRVNGGDPVSQKTRRVLQWMVPREPYRKSWIINSD